MFMANTRAKDSRMPLDVVLSKLDLGLNHVVRKWSETTDRCANMLISVPGGKDGLVAALRVLCTFNIFIAESKIDFALTPDNSHQRV